MAFKDMNRQIQTTKRPLDIIYLIDVSVSMEKNIQAVNDAMKSLGKLLVEESTKNPNVQLFIRIITFGGAEAKWHLKERTEIERFKYHDIDAVSGLTPFGDALTHLNEAIDVSKMDERSIPPLIVLLSDGAPNDEWEPSLERFLNSPWGKKSSKIAIAIGEDADYDMLRRFTTNESRVFMAEESIDLKFLIKWTSTLVSERVNAGCFNEEIGANLSEKFKVFNQASMLTRKSKSHL